MQWACKQADHSLGKMFTLHFNSLITQSTYVRDLDGTTQADMLQGSLMPMRCLEANQDGQTSVGRSRPP